jgi:hypothetical protein
LRRRRIEWRGELCCTVSDERCCIANGGVFSSSIRGFVSGFRNREPFGNGRSF